MVFSLSFFFFTYLTFTDGLKLLLKSSENVGNENKLSYDILKVHGTLEDRPGCSKWNFLLSRIPMAGYVIIRRP